MAQGIVCSLSLFGPRVGITTPVKISLSEITVALPILLLDQRQYSCTIIAELRATNHEATGLIDLVFRLTSHYSHDRFSDKMFAHKILIDRLIGIHRQVERLIH